LNVDLTSQNQNKAKIIKKLQQSLQTTETKLDFETKEKQNSQTQYN